MPTLSNPKVTINATDLTGYARSATFNENYPALNATVFGKTANIYNKGLGDHSLEVELFLTYAALESYASLKGLVGTTCTVKVNPANAVDSATNPGLTLTGAYLAELSHPFQLGEFVVTTVSFTGGDYSEDTTNP